MRFSKLAELGEWLQIFRIDDRAVQIHSDDANRLARNVEWIGSILRVPFEQHAPAFSQNPKRGGAVIRRLRCRLQCGQACQDDTGNARRDSQETRFLTTNT